MLKDVVSDADALRDRKVTRIPRSAAARCGWNTAARRSPLAREGARWEIREPEKNDADAASCAALVKAIADLTVLDFVAEPAEDPARYGLGGEALSVTLKTAAGDEEKILVGARYARGKKVYVTRGKETRSSA